MSTPSRAGIVLAGSGGSRRSGALTWTAAGVAVTVALAADACQDLATGGVQ